MFSPGAYRPDPTEGITAIADLPPPEIVPSRRNGFPIVIAKFWGLRNVDT